MSVCLLKELSQFKNPVNLLLQSQKMLDFKTAISIRTVFGHMCGSNDFLFHRHSYVIVDMTKENVQICQYVCLSFQHPVVILWFSFHFSLLIADCFGMKFQIDGIIYRKNIALLRNWACMRSNRANMCVIIILTFNLHHY